MTESSNTQCSGAKRLLCLLLLAAGDVHPCPGPNYKFPCGDCAKPVKRNQKGIACDTCDKWYHTKCLRMSDAMYFNLAEDESLPWECRHCECPFSFTESFFNASSTSDPDPEPPAAPGVPSGTASDTGSENERHIAADFVELRRKYPRNFITTHININSLQYKFDEISIILGQKLVDCLFISETKLNSSHLDQKFTVDHYKMYRRDNPLGAGGVSLPTYGQMYRRMWLSLPVPPLRHCRLTAYWMVSGGPFSVSIGNQVYLRPLLTDWMTL